MFAVGNEARGGGNVPGNAQFLGENVRGARGQNGQWNLRPGDAVDHFVDGAVAAADDEHFAAPRCCIASQFGGGAGARGRQESGINSGFAEDARGFFESVAAARAIASAGGIVNNRRVSNGAKRH